VDSKESALGFLLGCERSAGYVEALKDVERNIRAQSEIWKKQSQSLTDVTQRYESERLDGLATAALAMAENIASEIARRRDKMKEVPDRSKMFNECM
jgi:hypothetical protein